MFIFSSRRPNVYISFSYSQWHLNGESHDDETFGAPDRRSFGFKDTKYQWNRGHWKFIEEREDGSLKAFNFKDGMAHLGGKANEGYTTDFITNRAIEFINNQKDSKSPFALMLSFPDPHTPVPVRDPYASMFDDLDFLFPRTAVAAVNYQPALPAWAYSTSPILVETNLRQVSKAVEDLEASGFYQSTQRRIFGMVKLLDDSIGRILKVLQDNVIEDNTIVVFTSDHGSTMSEHNSDGKGQPYKTSAGVPFMIQWPEKIPKGKLIETAYSSVDFAPTLLNLLGANTEDLELHGIDASQDLLSDDLIISDETQTRFMDQPLGRWAAAVNQRFTFILSKSKKEENPTPWLLDSVEDPDEIFNYFNSNRSYREISAAMSADLYDNMVAYDFHLLNQGAPVFLAKPKCRETIDQLDGQQRFTVCKDYRSAELQDQCKKPWIWKACPVTCNRCEKDSWGKFVHKKELMTCIDLSDKGYNTTKNLCNIFPIGKFCGEVCLANTKASPTKTPSLGPSRKESQHPSAQPSVLPPSSSPSNTVSPSIEPSAASPVTNAPTTEQMSCQDSSTFTFELLNTKMTKIQDCAWLTKQNVQKRLNKYCERNYSGTLVKHACRDSCDNCNE